MLWISIIILLMLLEIGRYASIGISQGSMWWNLSYSLFILSWEFFCVTISTLFVTVLFLLFSYCSCLSGGCKSYCFLFFIVHFISREKIGMQYRCENVSIRMFVNRILFEIWRKPNCSPFPRFSFHSLRLLWFRFDNLWLNF